ncbi:MAG: ribosome-associated translation inhibitor RaiA [Zymomonas mobilis subsp. pomaceae]|uniref:Ribosome hibernation promoting factor n=1 Tax=Zymomonas mobilis subsp. pomaceae (strain ATCC 29192 / DSM 22645 / JCM 10191 / CCUG 17912 / NBRC 13757 / NCIMB 11200 / NRRL B-4491 / Barker I) TaxID=579138 RepID=F8ETV4_ZYMMT|nr:ribosome-associated translation inhibitor RaiA [Zymomonas mobilis]AEI38051.1 sigma 54 modulation protein/ribosomal protein S30EA [Zymomonas mobilis subsp. pomaceae ATCC 29192]MDX5949417.1 ribosome-associated translation inhibitor RaiA [Zymomonas mobilis subsp. pomaceae]GEB89160.1 hypothetical protein ZMO02_07970 [Zymomonas mobilis subsp. pomaceae]
MDIRISGHQIDTGTALRRYTTDHLEDVIGKYFPKCLSSTVTFGSRRQAVISCDIIVHVMRGIILKASGTGKDAHLAFDQALGKIEKQLRRHRSRLQSKMQSSTPAPALKTAALTPEEEILDNAHYTVFEVDDAVESGEHPPIIAEMQVDIPETSVSDAVLMLDLRNTTALLFLNSKTGLYNMVYRRSDGTIGWVEPN